MTVEELIEALQALPKDAQQKPAMYQRTPFSRPHEIIDVDYNLTVVALRV